MIDKTLGYNKLGIKAGISKENYNVNKLSKDNLVYKLKEGDIIKGSLVDNAGELILKMEDGTLVSAHTLKNMELGKLLSFLVVGVEDGKLVLKPQFMDKPEINNIIDKVIQDLSLPDDNNMKDIIHKILSKHMTLDKESLSTMYRAKQLYNLPSEVLINLKENNMRINIGDMKNLANLKEVKINDTINDLLKAIDNISNIEDLKSLISNITDKMDTSKFTDILSNLLNKNIDRNILSNVPSDIQSNGVKGYLEKIIADYTKDIGNNQNDIKKLSVQNVLDEIYKYSGSNKPIKQLARSMVQAYLHVDMDNIKKNPNEVRNINDLPNKLEEVYKELESKMKKQYENSSDNLKYPGIVNDINETISSIKKYNLEGQYYCFPMLIKEETRNGELYFFKPKKRSSKDDSNIYIVLALDMPNLDKVEVHIANKNDNVNLLIKVKSEDVKSYLEDRKDDLISTLKNSGYGVNDIEVKLLKEKENVDIIDIKEMKLHHLDIKA